MKGISVPFINLGLQYERYREQIIDKIDEIGRCGQYVGGKEIESFERRLAQICKTKYAIGVANGTDALVLIMKSLNIGYGDEVITAPNSFIASAGAIIETGATPVFVDVAEDYNLDPTKIERAITRNTKAILVVHLTGNPAKMDEINSIAQRHNLQVVEDAAQAIGAQYKQRAVGSLGIAAGFSLHPLKNIHLMGDAGFITTDDESLYLQLKKRQNHGLMNRDECEFWGQNSRIEAIQAAIGNIKLRDFDDITSRFCEIGRYYLESLEAIVSCPIIDEQNKSVFHNFVIQHPKRGELMDKLYEKGIETKVHYPMPLHLMRGASYLDYKVGDFAVAEYQANRIISLPIYPELSDAQVEYVVNKVKQSIELK